ncbi:MAG TPA: homoserine O-succinyltransferase [Gemmatimonadaceae bacterium]|nr:homoserine O-succinyltransferase [Gemmatimonadaceae bacterium]
MTAVVHADRRSGAPGALPRYEIVGPTDAPVIIVLGGISADAHICAHEDDARSGWWESSAGRGKALDTDAFRLVGVEFLDGGEGADGRPQRIVTTHEQAQAIHDLVDHIGVARVHAMVGASYGGMVALAFAERYAARLERLVVIGAAHRTHPLTTAWRVTQRRIVELGLATGRARDALIIARGLAMTTFRTGQEFARRFDVAPSARTQNDATFPVESYLRNNGERFADRFTPARFLALSLSGDLHAVDPQRIATTTTVVAEEGDLIVPAEDTAELAGLLAGPSRLVQLRSDHGHDAFLTDPQHLDPILRAALSTAASP